MISKKYQFTLLLFFLLLSLSNAQQEVKFINVSIGYGISAPYDDVEIDGEGFYAQGGYVLGIAKWFSVRPYAGIILTSGGKNELSSISPDFEATSKAFFLGGKVRVLAPIPWVAPYIEAGIGGSIGNFRTFTPFTSVEKKGVLFHIPVSLGLAIGRKNNYEIAFSYLFHNAAEQFSGAFAIGYTFPIKSD